MPWPYVIRNTHNRPRPLKYKTGAEKANTVVIYASTISFDDDGRRLLPGGSLLCKITSGAGADRYGPYSKTASDGRGSLTELAAVITEVGHDVTLGDRAVEGLYADCVFDKSELTLYGVSLHGTPLTSLKSAFPQATFDD
jgi:hypothetical protein